MSYKEKDLCVLQRKRSLCPTKKKIFVSYKEKDLCVLKRKRSLCPTKKKIFVSYKEKDLCVLQRKRSLCPTKKKIFVCLWGLEELYDEVWWRIWPCESLGPRDHGPHCRPFLCSRRWQVFPAVPSVGQQTFRRWKRFFWGVQQKERESSPLVRHCVTAFALICREKG